MGSNLLVVLAATTFFGAVGSPEEGIIAHYSFEEGQGSVAQDDSGRNHHGQIQGQPSRATGPWGTALRLDGQEGFVAAGPETDFSLDRAGSILFWFKPEASCQGGLLSWTSGSEQADQRLVISLNTYRRNKGRGERDYRELGVYLMNGQDTQEVHQSNFYEPYFPEPDRWLFLAVTFDGRTVNVYRDGVLVYSRFQALVPEAKSLSIWIGRCIGLGGASDYFKGLIDEARLFDRSLSEQEVYALYMKDAQGRDKDTCNFGGVGVSAKAYPRPGIIFADLDYRGLVPTGSRFAIRADLLDEKGIVVAAGEPRMLGAWGRAEVAFEAAALPAG